MVCRVPLQNLWKQLDAGKIFGCHGIKTENIEKSSKLSCSKLQRLGLQNFGLAAFNRPLPKLVVL